VCVCVCVCVCTTTTTTTTTTTAAAAAAAAATTTHLAERFRWYEALEQLETEQAQLHVVRESAAFALSRHPDLLGSFLREPRGENRRLGPLRINLDLEGVNGALEGGDIDGLGSACAL
jgi:hypothetical protein